MARPKKNTEIEKDVSMETTVNQNQKPLPQTTLPKEDEHVMSRQELADLEWDRLQKEETKMVKGRFRNLEMQGSAGYVCASKFKDVEPFMLTMEDEGIYEIPLYAARYINQYCSYPTYKEAKDEKGAISIKESTRIQRYKFEPLQSF